MESFGKERFATRPLVGKGAMTQFGEKERQSRAAYERDHCGVSRGGPCPSHPGKDRVIQGVTPLALTYRDESSSTGFTGGVS